MFEALRGKTNAQVYRKAFHDLLMAVDPSRPGTFLGNSQREDFLPTLSAAVERLSSLPVPRLLDVGAGSGEVVEFALCRLPGAVISFEEPNPLLLERYRQQIAKHPTLKRGAVYPGEVQDFYRSPPGRAWFAELPDQDLILAIHMIYHLTSFATEAPIDPARDIADLLRALYAKLAPGGTLFLVYADQTRSMGGRIGYRFFEQRSRTYARHLREIWNARNRLLRGGEAAGLLDAAHPGARCELRCVETPSRFFARSLEELAILSLTGELGTADKAPFDLSKAESAYATLVGEGAEMGVRTETEGPRKGMVGGNQPQVICEIRKLT